MARRVKTPEERAADAERKDKVLSMLRKGIPVDEIVEETGTPQRTVYNWREAELKKLNPLTRDIILNELHYVIRNAQSRGEMFAAMDRAIKILPDEGTDNQSEGFFLLMSHAGSTTEE